MNYDKDITIDELMLDKEWLDQAPLALKYARHLTGLKAKVARLEEKKKTIRSELILEVNQDPEELIGKKSPNAGDIEAYYRTDKGYKEVIKELLTAAEEAEFGDLAYKEIALTRKKALENMVVLHGQQYFAGPRVPHDLSEIRKQKTEAGQEHINLKRK